jgi:hypothetical protein
MGKEGKGGREEWKREGRNDKRRRLKVGKGRTGRKGKEREGKRRKGNGREGKRSVPSLKVFRHLHGYTNTRPFRQYPGV